jgi:glycerol-3-phosphate dehydrogenase
LIEKINFGEKLMNAKCITDTILIDGASNTIKDHMHLTKNYRIDDVTAKHLYSFYGTYSQVILERASVNGFSELDKDFPYLEEEIKYHIDEEYAVKVVDILIRRLSLALVDLQGARKIAGKVLGIMSKYLEWDNERVQKEEKAIEERLYTAL